MRNSRIKVFITISCLVMMVLSCSTPVVRKSTPTVPPEAVLTEVPTAEIPTEAPVVETPTEEPTAATGIPLLAGPDLLPETKDEEQRRTA